MSNDAGGCRSSSAQSFSIYHLSFSIGFCLVFLASGCSLFAPRKPLLYRVQGRVVDAATRQPLPNVLVRLAARIPTDFGPRTLAAFGMTRHDGTYDVELSEGFAVLRTAQAIRIEVSKDGFGATGADLPIPAKRESVYKVPDLFLAPVVRGAPMAPLRTGPPERPIPWQ